jgi:hypothetical protein
LMPRGAAPKTVENGLTAESYEIKNFSRTVSSSQIAKEKAEIRRTNKWSQVISAFLQEGGILCSRYRPWSVSAGDRPRGLRKKMYRPPS